MPIEVSRETRSALERYVALLLRWNTTVNLISRADEGQVWQRHVADCLQLVSLLEPAPRRAIDLGSGAGFPGLVLAVASGVHFDLIEADHRKAAFLREAARITEAPVTVHTVRMEAAALQPAPLITARACAPLPRLLDIASKLLNPGGRCLFQKGENAAAELTHAKTKWQMQVDRIPSQTNPAACILRISNLARVRPSP
jgi:16S rRNA (guanine527-N7)-methyltransferase